MEDVIFGGTSQRKALGMYELGIIDEANGAKARKALISREEWEKLKGILENE